MSRVYIHLSPYSLGHYFISLCFGCEIFVNLVTAKKKDSFRLQHMGSLTKAKYLKIVELIRVFSQIFPN